MANGSKDIPMYRFIIAATITFVVGLFIFTIIFRAYITFQQLEITIREAGDLSEEEGTLAILSAIPWALGGIYISLLGGIIYFLLRGNRPIKEQRPSRDFRKY